MIMLLLRVNRCNPHALLGPNRTAWSLGIADRNQPIPQFHELEELVEAHNLSLNRPSQLIVCRTPTEIAAQAEALLEFEDVPAIRSVYYRNVY